MHGTISGGNETRVMEFNAHIGDANPYSRSAYEEVYYPSIDGLTWWERGLLTALHRNLELAHTHNMTLELSTVARMGVYSATAIRKLIEFMEAHQTITTRYTARLWPNTPAGCPSLEVHPTDKLVRIIESLPELEAQWATAGFGPFEKMEFEKGAESEIVTDLFDEPLDTGEFGALSDNDYAPSDNDLPF